MSPISSLYNATAGFVITKASCKLTVEKRSEKELTLSPPPPPPQFLLPWQLDLLV